MLKISFVMLKYPADEREKRRNKETGQIRMTRRLSRTTIAIAWILGAATFANAADYLFTIGGGPNAEDSQASIEQNILYYRSIAEKLGIRPERHEIYFASGKGDQPDVCFDGSANTPAINRRLAELFNESSGVDLSFRHHAIPGVAGPATRTAILNRLHEIAAEIKPDDRLFLYVSGHGGEGTPLSNGHIYAWGHENLTVRDLAAAFDRFPPETTVAMVMVQCYAGTFANLLFLDGDPAKGLAPHRRVGFYATIGSQPAAGCDPDVHVARPEEYSTYFFSAASGHDRDGKPFDGADKGLDVDKNGRVTFAEAHVYSLIAAPTIDVSCKTSDLLLQTYSRLDHRDASLLAFDRDYSKLLAAAPPAEARVLEELSKSLKLEGEDRVAEAVDRAEQNVADREEASEETDELEADLEETRGKATEHVIARWPFLSNAWNPATINLMANRGTEIETALNESPVCTDWQRKRKQLDQRIETEDDAERDWAILERFIRTAKSVALAANLRKVADPAIVRRYEELRKLEDSLPAKP